METSVRTEDIEKEPLPGAYRTGVMMISTVPTVTVQPRVSGDVVVYKMHLECKHCGHQWTETVDETKF